MSTYNDPENTRSAKGFGLPGRPADGPAATSVHSPRHSVLRPSPAPRRSTCRLPRDPLAHCPRPLGARRPEGMDRSGDGGLRRPVQGVVSASVRARPFGKDLVQCSSAATEWSSNIATLSESRLDTSPELSVFPNASWHATRWRAPGSCDGRRAPGFDGTDWPFGIRPRRTVRELPSAGTQHRPRLPVSQTGNRDDH